MESVVPQNDSYDDSSTFTQTSAATAAAEQHRRAAGLGPRNSRSGVWTLRAQAVRPENSAGRPSRPLAALPRLVGDELHPRLR